jgi:tetratricopeptide (TPR) repeat protein
VNKERLAHYILQSEFQVTRELVEGQNKREVLIDLLDISFDTKNIAVYFFLEDWIYDKESAELHSMASSLLSVAFAWVPRAYHIAFRHIRQAIKLEPSNLDYKEMILEYHEIPECLLSLEEAIDHAEQVIEREPKSKIARNFLR